MKTVSFNQIEMCDKTFYKIKILNRIVIIERKTGIRKFGLKI